MSNVTKKELIDSIVDRTKEKRTVVRDVVQIFLDSLVEHLGQGRRIELRDFGVFEVRERAPRTAQNPKTLQKVRVPAKRSVKFKPGRLMKDRINNGADDAVASTQHDERIEPPVVEVKGAKIRSRI